MTEMIDIDDFLPEVMRYAPNASELAATRFVRQAARELCDRVKMWRENDDLTITTPELQGVITISDAAIVAIQAAVMDGIDLEPVTPSWLDDRFKAWSTTAAEAAPARYVTQIRPDTVTVYPRATGTLSMRLVLKPSRTAAELPAFLLEDYNEEIGRGAAGRLLTEPNSENPQLGLDHRTWFESRLNTLAYEAARGQQGAPLRSKGAYF